MYQPLLLLPLLLTSALATPHDPTTHQALDKRASFPIPASKGSVTYSAAKPVSGVFDGGMKTYGRGVKCTGQKEGGDKDAVFILEDGATLKNAIIGADQIEGVHCKGSCTIQNVWWTDVCEDALTLKGSGSGTHRIIGGGARNADDKVIQHNSGGKVTIQDFTVQNFGKLYRACGNCSKQFKRTVEISGVKASSGKALVGINSNYGDTATISGCASSVKEICVEYEGTDNNDKEPKKKGSGPSNACKYTEPLAKC
ncbi:probable pectate lyase E [Aspergillus lentulus]|uniref:Pectate lyase n=1 Tax=Aspergillus lentulus TaxID=293939 RepID=A0ABQ1AFJ7_ASPLE|nr:probable pectate lyase E [Aspergillus lentulus]GFF38871.1 probable pectate lyase E [Aspergillus lentulus]GFF80889.1 probable pectate lyase E [Aspergillus lentulus]GFG09991.1 probable pectate lyase E [Aspergillus lentulus]